MKVLHLRSSGGFYGAENVIVQIASQLLDVDITVGVIARDAHDSELFKRCQSQKINAKIFHCKGLIDSSSITQIRQYLQDNQIDILHTHDYKSTVLGWLASKGLNIKRVSTNHLWDDIDLKLWIYQRIEGILYNWFDRIVAVSDPVAKDVYPFLINKKKLSVISNGIDCDVFANNHQGAEVRASLGIGSKDIVVGLIGRLSQQKGHVYLMEAAKELIINYSHIKFVFWGDGHLKESLVRSRDDLGLQKNVIFAGVTNNMPTVYSTIDILAMPSLSEGLPMTLIEAMAAGVPAVVTPVGDIPKVIKDGETGFIVKVQDVNELAKKVEVVIEKIKDGSIETIIKKARKLVEDKYSARVMAGKYLEIYERLSGKLRA